MENSTEGNIFSFERAKATKREGSSGSASESVVDGPQAMANEKIELEDRMAEVIDNLEANKRETKRVGAELEALTSGPHDPEGPEIERLRADLELLATIRKEWQEVQDKIWKETSDLEKES